MKYLHLPRALVVLLCATSWQASAAAQCGPDGEIPDRATLDAILAGSQTLEDFEAFQISQGSAVILDVSSLDSTTIANGQGPGLVQPGATYSMPDPVNDFLQWNGDQYFSRTTKTIVGGPSPIMNIVYAPSVQAMGVDFSGFDGFGYTGEMRVYDTSDALLGTVTVTVGGGAARDFAGWQHLAGIGRVELEDFNNPFSPNIDDHGFGDCDPSDRVEKYCNPSDGHPNNTSSIDVSGNVLSQGPIDICMSGGPQGQFGYLLIGSDNQIVQQPPGAKGDLCIVGGFIGRYDKDVGVIDSAGSLCTDIENSLSSGAGYGIPNGGGAMIQPGETWYFQYWHRQPMGQPATFSEAACVTFKP